MQNPDDRCPTRYNEVELSLGRLHEEIHVAMLKLSQRLMMLTSQTNFTQDEAALVARRSKAKVKQAIKGGKLVAQESRWIARPDLLRWMGYDAIRHFTDSICSMKESLITISDQIASLRRREALKSFSEPEGLPGHPDQSPAPLMKETA
jgi:hypothetical protein